MRRMSNLNVRNNEFYDLGTRDPAKNGCLDPRLGVSSKKKNCKTCGKDVMKCCGHFGTIELALPVFHIGYFNSIKEVLSMICKTCSRVLLDEDQRKHFTERISVVTRSDSIHSRVYLQKEILKQCKLIKVCPHCFELNGPVKKINAAKGPQLSHAVWQLAGKSKKYRHFKDKFQVELQKAASQNVEIEQNKDKAQHDLNPEVVLKLFRQVPDEDLSFLQSKTTSRPEDMLLTHVLVPPVCIRPSVNMQAGASSEDDLTMLVQFIIEANNVLRANLQKGAAARNVKDAWDHLSIQVSTFFNGAYSANKLKNSKLSRGLCQRLKGKQGRFRGNLSGKRVDFSGRTVISPDPNLDVHQVAVPESVAKILTYPERVTKANIERLRQAVSNGTLSFVLFFVVRGRNCSITLSFSLSLPV
jgi:DNA-directed RNA polymerase III subunit RPC1